MPNRFEMESLLDFGNQDPALPVDHPFHNVSFFTYWTSTSSNANPGLAHAVDLTFGNLSRLDKTYSQAVWPVRGPGRNDDSLDDHKDNCPTVSNPNQKDVDTEGIGDYCDPDTVNGTISGDVQAGFSIEISLVSCGNTNPVAATTTNAEGYYAFGGLSNGKYGIIPQNTLYLFNPVSKIVVIPLKNKQVYNIVSSTIYTISDTVSEEVQEER